MSAAEPPSPPTPPNVAALVDAIDVRSRQAGAEGASEVIQRMLGSVTDVLSGLQDRLDALEGALTSGSERGPSAGMAEAVQAGLATFNARLGRLEEAFVSAVEESGSGTEAVVDEVRTVVVRALEESASAAVGVGVGVEELGAAVQPLVDRLGAVERRLSEAPRANDLATSVESALDGVQARIARLEAAVRDRPSDPVDPPTAVRAALAPMLERLDQLEASTRSTASSAGDGLGRVEAALAALPGRLTALEEQVSAAVASGPADAASSAVDETVLARLEEAVDRLDRDEASARLVQLVEERLSIGLRAVTERTDEVRRAIDQLVRAPSTDDDRPLDEIVASLRALQTATRAVPDEVASSIGARLVTLGDRLDLLSQSATGTSSRLDALAASVSELAARPAPADEREALDALGAQVSELVTRPSPTDVGAGLESLAGQLAELATRPAPTDGGPGLESLSTQVADLATSVRREAELLTQRVAALAVGVEASRVLLEQHLQETENSIGRKAGEVTRRLAADFGIKSRRNAAPGGRRDPRELGSG